MKIDFKRTEEELLNQANAIVRRLNAEHPEAIVTRFGLWGKAVLPTTAVVVEVIDDGRNLGRDGVLYEWDEHQFGDASHYEWWPDPYEIEEGERYEIEYKEGWEFPAELLEGDDELDIPLFALMISVVQQANWEALRRSEDFRLSANIGNGHWLATKWEPQSPPDVSATVKYLASEFEAFSAGLRPPIPTTHELLRFREKILKPTGSRPKLNSLMFLQDEETLLGVGNGMQCINVESAEVLWDNTDGYSRASKCRQTDQVATFYEGVTIWDMTNQTIEKEVIESETQIWSAAFSPTGQHLATVDDDGAVRIWGSPFTEPGQLIADNLRCPGQLNFSPDGEFLVHVSNGGNKSVVLYHLASQESTALALEHKIWPKWTAFSPDGNFLATAGGEDLNVWNLREQCLQYHLEYQSDYGWHLFDALSFSPDSAVLFAGGSGRVLTVLDVITGEQKLQIADPVLHASIEDLAINAAGTRLATCDNKGQVDLWDIKALLSSLSGG